MKFIITESQYNYIFEKQLSLDIDVGKNYLNKLCKSSKNINSGACKLQQLRPSLDDELKKELDTSITTLYKFFGWKNSGVLPKIIELSLETPEKVVSSLKTISDFINDKTFKNDETKRRLRQLKTMTTIPDDLDDILRVARQKEYSKYEDSFVGDYFEENRTGLSLSYKCGDEIDIKFLDIIEKFRGLSKNQFKKYLNDIKMCIISSLDEGIAVKSDVKTKTPLYVEEDGEKIEVFPAGSIFEIKKMDTGIDSYLSEFFSVFKQSSNKELKSTHLNVYNAVIQGIYEWIKRKGKPYLEKIKSNMSGMIYDNYTIIPIEYIELYWSNLGQRGCNERRLSIRFRIKPEYSGKSIPGYVFTQTSNILERKDVIVSSDDVTYRIC